MNISALIALIIIIIYYYYYYYYYKEHELPEVLPGQVEMRDPQSGVKFGR